MKTKLYMIGGFLGSGKTTLLCALAARAVQEGIRAGLITNDQAAGLVDTEFLKKQGVPVEEVSGSCFCCNFPGFIQAVQKLQEHADVIFAEAVGSCTDLTATIIQPLEDKYKDFLSVMPFTVLADPERLGAVLAGKNAGLAADAAYILRMQMEEADFILISKADTLTEKERRDLIFRTKKKFPLAEVLCISAKEGEGVDRWIEMMEESAIVPGRHPAEVDYDRYAAGEAALGWLNMTFDLPASDQNRKEQVETFLGGMADYLEKENIAVGHIKLMLENEAGWVKGHLTGGRHTLRIEEMSDGTDSRKPMQAILNARVETSPENLVHMAVERVQEVFSGSGDISISRISALRPGRPNPTWHYSHGRSDREQVDLFLITGFLGAGKTTFLRNMLQKNGEEIPTGVIVNEYGSVGLDAESLQSEDSEIVQINNGSIFCACMKGGFVRTLAEFLTKPVERLFVEASGMADPSSMEKILEEMTPYLRERFHTGRSYRYRGAVCIVDAVNFIDLSSNILAGYNQVKKSNLILLNKTDLCSHQETQKVREVLAYINPDAAIYETTYAAIPEKMLDTFLRGETIAVGPSTNRCSDRLFAGELNIPRDSEESRVRRFLTDISGYFVRVKGWIRVQREGESMCVRVDGVGPVLNMEKSEEPQSTLIGRMQLISDSETDRTQYLQQEWKKYMTGEFSFAAH